ncbi:hypothetical protein [Candidatus Nephthysia bennettiae]|uniref:Uncharacterized protein n=1 Tax=Candidatus Nephthysia bennettiae TaxID=3127016 RepID=A0A934NBN5_9BACT|nr:hypothetical protein [Candidatus Dormibacteraeota bacterium]
MRVKVVLGVRGADRDLEPGEVLELEDDAARLLGGHVVVLPDKPEKPEKPTPEQEPGRKRGEPPRR